MDSDKPNTRINPAEEEFDRTQAALAAKRARRIVEAAQTKTEPGAMTNAVPIRAWPAVRP